MLILIIRMILVIISIVMLILIIRMTLVIINIVMNDDRDEHL